MKLQILAVLAGVSTALIAPPASATLLFDSVDFTTSVTGNTTIQPLGTTANVLVGPGTEFGACVGPNSNNCVTSGLSVAVDVAASSILFSFAGSTSSATGSFSIRISNINDIINNVTGGPMAFGLGGQFALNTFDAHSITFTGTPGPNYDAVNGRSVTFNIDATPAAAPVPEPGTLALVGLGIAALGVARRRKA